MEQGPHGVDLTGVADLATQVGTTGTLGMTDLAADPIFEFTIAIVVLTSGISGN